MQVRIKPGSLHGSIPAIPSKSQAHRLLICAALADGPTEIVCPVLSRDIEATADCLRALGAKIRYEGGVFTVDSVGKPVAGAVLDCGESGSTLRFLLPVLCAMGAQVRLKLRGRLPERPLSPLWEELERHGARLSRPTADEIAVDGAIGSGDYMIAGNVSSQFVSGLLLALPMTGGGSITLTGKRESVGYIAMTRQAQAIFGVECGADGRRFDVPGARHYRSPGRVTVEGDWSNAAFWAVADALSGGGVTCRGLDANSSQGDRIVIEMIQKIRKGGAVVDAGNIPDLIPVLAVLAAVSPGQTEFVNAGRLRLKESDRLASVSEMLRTLGGRVTERDDGLTVEGIEQLRGGVVDSVGDHRIAMSAAVAAIACRETVTVLGAETVEKSYPGFWRDFAALGGCVEREEEA